jgi:hypothetical protein
LQISGAKNQQFAAWIEPAGRYHSSALWESDCGSLSNIVEYPNHLEHLLRAFQ